MVHGSEAADKMTAFKTIAIDSKGVRTITHFQVNMQHKAHFSTGVLLNGKINLSRVAKN